MKKKLLETELLVIGGGIAGVAAACAASSQGRKTCLIEQRTYPGAEVTAVLRPWLSADEYAFFRKHVPSVVEGYSKESPCGEYMLVPDRFKIALENTLMAADVKIFYNIRAFGYWKDDRYHIETAGKSGISVITASEVIDATENAVTSQCALSAVPRYDGQTLKADRTAEFTGVDTQKIKGYECPSDGTYDYKFHIGFAEEGHLYLEHSLDCLPEGSGSRRMRSEINARYLTMDLAGRLINEYPAFSEAKITKTSYELRLPAMYRSSSVGATGEKIRTRAGEWDAGFFRSPEGFWIAGGCADIGDHDSRRLSGDIAALWELGNEIGRKAALCEGFSPAETPSLKRYRLPLLKLKTDVLVVGGGVSGTSASVASANSGAGTILVEMNPGLGGTGTLGGVDSYWFGRRCGYNALISSLVEQEHRQIKQEWYPETAVKWNVELKMHALLKAAIGSGVDVFTNSISADVLKSDEGRITGVLVCTPDNLLEIESKVVVDATGDGDIAVLAGADHIYGSDREAITMWYSMTPEEQPGRYRNNFTSTVDVGEAEDYTRAILSARRRYPGHDHAIYLAPRESRHIIGNIRLTLTDQLLFRKWPDVINICFSNNDIKGHSTSDWIKMGLIPPNLEIEIPFRALIPKGIKGLLIAGKAFSTDHDAMPSIRMQADMENQGAVCGIAAAMSSSRGIVPGKLPVRDLQEELVRRELLPEEILSRKIEEYQWTEEKMIFWIDKLSDKQKLYDYSDMELTDVHTEPIPIVMVCTAGPNMIPLLKERLKNYDPERRLSVARALAWYGQKEAFPVLTEYIMPYLEYNELPPRTSFIRHVNPPPDQGAMPDPAYLLYTLAMCRDERSVSIIAKVQSKLKPSYEKFVDEKNGLFYYADSICDIADRLRHPDCIPVLRKLHGEPLFSNKVFYGVMQPDFFEERMAYLEIVIARSMARCGDEEGIKILTGYLDDKRYLLRRHALNELTEFTHP